MECSGGQVCVGVNRSNTKEKKDKALCVSVLKKGIRAKGARTALGRSGCLSTDFEKTYADSRFSLLRQRILGGHHWFNGHEFGQTLGDSEGQGSLVCCNHGVTKSWMWHRDWTTQHAGSQRAITSGRLTQRTGRLPGEQWLQVDQEIFPGEVDCLKLNATPVQVFICAVWVCVCLCVYLCSLAQLCLTLCDPWTIAYQALLSMEFSRQEYWSEWVAISSSSDLPDPGKGLHLISWVSCIGRWILYHWAPWEAPYVHYSGGKSTLKRDYHTYTQPPESL